MTNRAMQSAQQRAAIEEYVNTTRNLEQALQAEDVNYTLTGLIKIHMLVC